MAIDLQSETVMSLTEAAKTLPPIDGRRIHVSTLWRWTRKGVRGVQLEHVRLGHRVCTSVEAVQRFAEALARIDAGPQAAIIPPREVPPLLPPSRMTGVLGGRARCQPKEADND